MAVEPTIASPWGFRLLIVGTSARIVLAPVIMALVLMSDVGGDRAAVIGTVLFVSAALTDFFDGRAARRWNLTSPLGSFLDTTADKLLVACVLFALVDQNRVASWAAAIIVSRELLILGLRSAVAVGGTVVEASQLGKIKASVQFFGIALAILRPGDPIAGWYADEWVMVAVVLVTLASGADYVVRFASQLRQ